MRKREQSLMISRHTIYTKIAKHICIPARFFLLSCCQQLLVNKFGSMVHVLLLPLCNPFNHALITSIVNEHAKEAWAPEMWARMLKVDKVENSKFVLNPSSSRSHLSQFGCTYAWNWKMIYWAPKGKSSHFFTTSTFDVIMDSINPLCLVLII